MQICLSVIPCPLLSRRMFRGKRWLICLLLQTGMGAPVIEMIAMNAMIAKVVIGLMD